MHDNEIGNLYNQLPNEAKREAILFLNGLLARYKKTKTKKDIKKVKITDDPCIGLWKDRTDIIDSVMFVKELRLKQWNK